MNAGLYDSLIARAGAGHKRFHIPGHKGKPNGMGALGGAALIDYTELAGTGDLYRPDGDSPIAASEAETARAYGAGSCVYLTGGSTQGVFTAMSSLCRPGDYILVDRNSHTSVFNAMALLDLIPRFLYPGYVKHFDITGGIAPSDLWDAICRCGSENLPKPAMILVTSPNYYGVMMDIRGLAEVAGQFNIPLAVDGAHGAHLPFTMGLGAISQGADIEICSAHKTLPALGQAAFLLAAPSVQPGPIRHHASVFGTASPSYLIMASIDLARAYMQAGGAAEYLRAAEAAQSIRDAVNCRGRFYALSDIDAGLAGGAGVDSCRLTVCVMNSGMTGTHAARILEEEFSIVPELADRANIVFVITCSDSDGDLAELGRALEELESRGGAEPEWLDNPVSEPPPRVLTPRQAMYAPKRLEPVSRCEGFTAGQNIAPVPPGVPIIAAGEIITAGHMSLLAQRRCDTDILVIDGQAEEQAK